MPRILRVEALETRTLLASDFGFSAAISLREMIELAETEKEMIQATHHYVADGQQVGMVILSDRVAIRSSINVAEVHSGQLLQSAGLTKLRTLSGGFHVYATQEPLNAATLATLKESGWAEQVVPVFGLLESQSEAVLLNEVIITLPEGVAAEDYFSQDVFSAFRRLDGTPDQFVATLSAGYGEQALSVINELSADPQIVWASPNFYQDWKRFAFFPNDEHFPNQWHLHNTGQGGGLADADPNMPEAWGFFQPDGPPSSIVIGIVDDGVATDHPDLFNWVNAGEVQGNGMDDDGNGWVDDVNGWNFVDNNNFSQPTTSTDNHGTAVAGVAAARGNNEIGVTGASYNSPVISSRIFRGNAVASDAGIASAIYYTSGRTQNGLGTWPAAHIVNHSWGGGGASSAITAAVTWATTQARGGLGVPQVFAAGNSFGAVAYPASLSLSNPGVIAIGAMNNQGEKSNYSSFGAAVDIVTPSNDTRSGFLAIDTTDRLAPSGYNSTGEYTGTGSTGFGGTSSAAPLAAGIGALALARAQQLGVDLTAAQLRSLMRNNTKLAGSTEYTLPLGRNDLMGYGLLNAETLIRGIGRSQISVTTSNQVLGTGGTVDFGQTIVGGVSEVTFRIRNQGTENLILSGLSLNSPDFFISEGLGTNQLGLGESTTFSIRFTPSTPGAHSASVSVLSNDSLLPSLEFELTGIAQNTTISGFFFEDRDGDGLFSVGERTLANQTVFIDQNGNGVYDADIASTSLTNSTPAGIFDLQTTTSTINVSGMNAAVTDVQVTVNLNHTFVGDLTLHLVAPDETRVLLFNRRGSSGNNLVNTTFTDQASQLIGNGTAPFTGSFRPEQPLSNFFGVNPNGTWTLEVRDNATADQGTLLDWTLEITGGELVTTTNEFGFYSFVNVPNGTYSLIGIVPDGWTASGTNQHPFTVSNPSDSFSGRHLGVGKNNRLYARVFEDINGDGIVNPGEKGLGGQTIFLDVNSNGVYDPPQTTTWTNANQTSITDFSILNLPVFVSGLDGKITDVDITLNLNHTWVGDLEISLISPAGTQIMLSNRRGGIGSNFVNTFFDDSAPVSILEGSAPFTGSYRPEAPLAQLNGLSPNGVWNLRIRDLAFGDTGTFINWTLHLKTEVDVEVETDSDGWVSLDLPSSTQSTVALIPQPEWEFTVPTDGAIQISPSGQPIFNQLFGTRQAVASIVGAHVYHAGWSGTGSALDTSKTLAKEGIEPQTLGFENLINTAQGINGVVLDIQGLSGLLSAADFVFQVSPTGAFSESLNPPSSWSLAPQPSSISVISGAPNQVLIRWPNNAIANRWLRLTVLANSSTRLPAAEVYYIGHLLGETTGPVNEVYTVSFADITLIRSGVGQTVGVSSPLDVDKNGTISFADIAAMRPNVGQQLTNITIQSSGVGSTSLNSRQESTKESETVAEGELWSLQAAPAVDPVRSRPGDISEDWAAIVNSSAVDKVRAEIHYPRKSTSDVQHDQGRAVTLAFTLHRRDSNQSNSISFDLEDLDSFYAELGDGVTRTER